VIGLYSKGHLLSWHGLYQGFYRVGSRPTHGAVLTLMPYVSPETSPVRVAEPSDGPILTYALAAPIFAMVLVIAAQRFNWIDEEKVRRLNARATARSRDDALRRRAQNHDSRARA
jgi:H+/gluconate symporter-like permease